MLKPNLNSIHEWEFYADNFLTEYNQSIEEGLDISAYKSLFEAAAALPRDEIKKRIGDVLFDIVANAKTVEGYAYEEPSEIDAIRAQRKDVPTPGEVNADTLEDQLYGAWLGRICGCMLGKTVEGIKTHELVPFLKETGNYPMHRYIRRTDLTDEILAKYTFNFAERAYADEIDGMPVDDDTNYVVLAQEVISKYGRDFTPYDMSRAWLDLQPRGAYCTAERVAFHNFIEGYDPPVSAVYQNPYREWIGAQIRGDYFGYINPGDPETAADMAFRDASISHIKNGIYGEMFAAAMIAAAAATTDIHAILAAGIAQIPAKSRLHEAVRNIVKAYDSGVSQADCFAHIHRRWNEYTAHDWCHTISNAEIVAAALLYGEGNYGKSICMAVETGFDTDCNGATVGSVLGMAYGTAAIGDEWAGDIHDKLYTSIFGVGAVKISERVKMTLAHLK